MFHVFISYAHEDGRDYRDTIIGLLKKSGFKDADYWYDERDIEVGEEWRTQIDKALNESFIVIIILTKGALKSHFVTYEWARAIGDGIKIIPIVFSDLPKKLDHPLLERKQYIDWRKDGIPEKVMLTIEEYRKIPPDTIYLNKMIVKKVLPFRVLVRVWLWMYSYTKVKGLIDQKLFDDLNEVLWDEWRKLHEYLPQLMVDKSNAFISKQVRATRSLIRLIGEFWEIFHEKSAIDPTMWLSYSIGQELIHDAERWRTKEFEPIIAVLESSDSDIDPKYQKLDYYLKKISDKSMPPDGMPIMPPHNELLWSAQFNAIIQSFDDEAEANRIIEAIQTILKSQN